VRCNVWHIEYRGSLRSALFMAIAIVAMLIVIGLFGVDVWLSRPRHSGTVTQVRLKQICVALSLYYEDWRALPYHELGEEYALYLLKEYVPGPEVFDMEKTPEPAHWDDGEKALKGADYRYLNPKDENIPDSMRPLFVRGDFVLFEQVPKLRNRYWYIIIPGWDSPITTRSEENPMGSNLGREVSLTGTPHLGKVVVPAGDYGIIAPCIDNERIHTTPSSSYLTFLTFHYA